MNEYKYLSPKVNIIKYMIVKKNAIMYTRKKNQSTFLNNYLDDV